MAGSWGKYSKFTKCNLFYEILNFNYFSAHFNLFTKLTHAKPLWEGIKIQGYFSIGKKVKVWERILRGTENMGRNEGMGELLMKISEGITEIMNYQINNQGFSLSRRE